MADGLHNMKKILSFCFRILVQGRLIKMYLLSWKIMAHDEKDPHFQRQNDQ